MTEENYIKYAKIIAKDMLNYKTKSKSFTQVYDVCLNKYIKDPTEQDKNKILVKAIHFITILGYDIDNIKPCKFKKYKY